MLNCKAKALVCSPLFFACAQLPGQLHPKNCAGAPVYRTEGLQPDKADLEVSLKPSCQRMPHYLNQTIFTGTVTRVIKSEGRALFNGECSYTELQTVTIAVKEVFFGNPPKIFTFHAGDINGAYFDEKRTYLVIGRQKPDGSFVANSLATKPIDMAKNDLAYLRSMPNKPPTAELFGGVYSVFAPPHNNVIPVSDRTDEGLKISLEGPMRIETKTDRSGQFKVSGLASGRYTIQLESNAPMESDRVQTVDVAPRGCAEINFYIVKPFPPARPEKKH